MTEDEFRKTVLEGVGGIRSDIDSLKARNAELESKNGIFEAEMKRMSEELVAAQKAAQSRAKSFGTPAKPGQVSLDCARHLGAVAYAAALRGGQFNEASKRSLAESQAKEILGAEFKTAVTSSDIPLPTEYQGEVVELVATYGTARKFGTVFPLGSGTVKLPKLSTDPTFGLVAASATVTEVVPQAAFVTFTAEKFGGTVRLPSEIDEDSVIALGQFLARYAARNIARAEDWNFWASTGAGSGVNGSVKGFSQSTITNSKVAQMGSGDMSISDAVIDDWRALRAVPDAAALENAAYFMHPSLERLLVTYNASGNRPYNPNAQIAGKGANPITSGPTLDGFPIYWIPSLPVYTASDVVSSVYALFGDPSYQYLGIRGGMSFATSTEAGFATDEILVRAMERFTIGLMATGCMAGLETAAA